MHAQSWLLWRGICEVLFVLVLMISIVFYSVLGAAFVLEWRNKNIIHIVFFPLGYIFLFWF